MESIRNRIDVPVIDMSTGEERRVIGAKGEHVSVARAYWNTPYAELWKDEPIAILDWSTYGKKVIAPQVKTAKLDAEMAGATVEEGEKTRRRLWMRALATPIQFRGEELFGALGWGSGAKDLQSLGMSRDVLVDSGLVKAHVHAVYTMRAILPNSRYGACRLPRANVRVVPSGTNWRGYQIEDGCSLVSRSVYDCARDEEVPLVGLNRPAKSSYLRDMRIDWSEVADEAIGLIHEKLRVLDTTTQWQTVLFDQGAGEYRRELAELDPVMMEHPYLTRVLERGVKEMLAELSSTIPLPGVVRVAVPIQEKGFVFPGEEGQLVIVRWPPDNWLNIRAVDTGLHVSTPDTLARVAGMEVAQATLFADKQMFAKGNLVVVDDELMDGYDFILTSDDIKMKTGTGVPNYRQSIAEKGPRTETYFDLYMCLTNAWAPGAAFGVDAERWKVSGGDFDGDMCSAYRCDSAPVYWNAVAAMNERERDTASFKIRKVYAPLSERVKMLYNSFFSGIGVATNVVSTTFAVAPSDREVVAAALAFVSVHKLDLWCNTAIKVMTDGFKTMIDLIMWLRIIMVKQSKLTNLFKSIVPWAGWRRNEWAFLHGVPRYRSELPEDEHELARTSKTFRGSAYWRAQIPDEMAGCTVAQIYNIVRPWLESRYDEELEEFTLMDFIRVRPISQFANWAPEVEPGQQDLAWQLKDTYDAIRKGVNWSDHKVAVPAFKETWRRMVQMWVDRYFSGNRRIAAWAVWRAAHHSRAKYASAGMVFVGFPDEVREIVSEKPGLMQNRVRTRVVGLDRNVIGLTLKLYGAATVDIVRMDWGGRSMVVMLAVGEFPGLSPERRPYNAPSTLIGIVPTIEGKWARKGYQVPPLGRYLCKMKQAGGAGTYIAKMTRVD
jgi:hypothetical protein